MKCNGKNLVNTANVGKPSAVTPHLFNIRELLPEGDPVDVMSVERDLSRVLTAQTVRRHAGGKPCRCGGTARGKTLVTARTLLSVKGFRLNALNGQRLLAASGTGCDGAGRVAWARSCGMGWGRRGRSADPMPRPPPPGSPPPHGSLGPLAPPGPARTAPRRGGSEAEWRTESADSEVPRGAGRREGEGWWRRRGWVLKRLRKGEGGEKRGGERRGGERPPVLPPATLRPPGAALRRRAPLDVADGRGSFVANPALRRTRQLIQTCVEAAHI